MDEIAIFWRHIGREHGLGEYTADIRRNPEEILRRYQERKVQGAKRGAASHRFVKVSEDLLLELAGQESLDPFLICYLISEGLQFSLGYKKGFAGWLIDIVEIVEVEPNVYSVGDLFLDVRVHPDGRYEVLDIEDFRRAIELDIIDRGQTLAALHSLDWIIARLNNGDFPFPWLGALVEDYAPARI